MHAGVSDVCRYLHLTARAGSPAQNCVELQPLQWHDYGMKRLSANALIKPLKWRDTRFQIRQSWKVIATFRKELWEPVGRGQLLQLAAFLIAFELSFRALRQLSAASTSRHPAEATERSERKKERAQSSRAFRLDVELSPTCILIPIRTESKLPNGTAAHDSSSFPSFRFALHDSSASIGISPLQAQ